MPATTLILEFVTFLFAVAVTYAVGDLVSDVRSVRRRLDSGGAATAASVASFLRKRTVTNPILLWVQSSSSISEAKERGKLARDLAKAGFENPAAPVWYVIIRFSLAIGLPALYLFAETVAGNGAGGVGRIFWALVLCALGLLGPRSFIDRRGRARQTQLERQFPDALDLMVVCVEAGLGLAATFVRVSHEMRETHPLISAEFDRVSEQFRAGQGQNEALRSMADRCDAPVVKSCAALLIQTEQLGGSIGQSLRTFSEEMRETRMMKAEEKALRIPVMLTIPLVACILPVIIVALMLPAMIDVVRVIMPALRGQGG
jgi:tight adherence protein C